MLPPEHPQKVDGFSNLLILDLTVQVFIDHPGALFGCDVKEQIFDYGALNTEALGHILHSDF